MKRKKKGTAKSNLPKVIRSKPSENLRKVKIHSKIRLNLYDKIDYPEIKLSGIWLKKIGFDEGKIVDIITSKGEIIIRLAKTNDEV